jgi:hypothetical protein
VGPTCAILLDADDELTLDSIDSFLESIADRIDRTRRGRVWDIWVRDRPVHVQIAGTPPEAILSAGCNQPEDYDVLRDLVKGIVDTVGGFASEPEK